MKWSRLVPVGLTGALMVSVACQDGVTAPRSPQQSPSSFDVGPTTYSALWAVTEGGLTLKYTSAPTGPEKPSGVDTLRAEALRARFQGISLSRQLRSASAQGQTNASGPQITRQAWRVRRVSLGKVNGKEQVLGLIPGEGQNTPIAAMIVSNDREVSAVIQMKHTRRANGKWRLIQSRTTVFGKDRKAVAVVDQSYGDAEFASAARSGSLDLAKRFASLVLPDELHAATLDDAEAACPVEAAALAAAYVAVGAASSNLAAATAAEGAAVGWLATAIATCETTGITCLIIPAAEAAALAASAALATATGIFVAAVGTTVVAAANLAICVATQVPTQKTQGMWVPSSGGGGGGGWGDEGGSGSGGGSPTYTYCEFDVYVDSFGYVLWVDDPQGCLTYAM